MYDTNQSKKSADIEGIIDEIQKNSDEKYESFEAKFEEVGEKMKKNLEDLKGKIDE